MNRNLDGMYFRIKRNGEFTNVCFSDLTEEEMECVMVGKSKDWLKSACINLANTIKRIGEELDLVCE